MFNYHPNLSPFTRNHPRPHRIHSSLTSSARTFFFLFTPPRFLEGNGGLGRGGGARDRVQIEERQGRNEVRYQARLVPQVPHSQGHGIGGAPHPRLLQLDSNLASPEFHFRYLQKEKSVASWNNKGRFSLGPKLRLITDRTMSRDKVNDSRNGRLPWRRKWPN